MVLYKFVTEDQSFVAILAYGSWGIGIGGLMLYLGVPSIRRAFHYDVSRMRRRGMAVIFANEGIFLFGKAVSFLAVTMGSATLVSVLAGTQVFFGILLGWILMLIAPAIFKEDVGRQDLIRKALLASVMFAGIVLVN